MLHNFFLFNSCKSTNPLRPTIFLNSFERIREYGTFAPVKKLKTFKPWFHKNIELSNGEDYIEVKTIQKYLHSLDRNHNFMLVILIISEQGMKVAPNKMIENISHFSDATALQEKINFEISTIVERYHIENVYNVIFRYREFVTKVPVIMPSTFNKKVIPIARNTKNNLFTDYYAPFSLDSRNFGKILEDNGDKILYLYKDRFILEREFKPENNHESYTVNVLNKNNKELILSFKDVRLKHSGFIRSINGYTLNINQGKITMFESEIKSKFIQGLNKDYIDNNEMNNFITYDLECYKDENNNFVPYAAAWYKNNETKIYYLSDYDNPTLLIQKSFDDLFIPENKNCMVYVHNNKGFDSIFTLKPLLAANYKIHSVQKGKNILSLSITKNSGTKQSIKIIIKDSYLLLPSSLSNLCKSYKLDTVKGYFPHDFASKENLNYIGKLPSREFYFNTLKKEYSIKLSEYTKLAFITKNNWSFKEELIKYLKLDVITLHKIIVIVRELTYKQEDVDITKVLSNAGLSFRIFKMNYLSQIPEEIFNKKRSYSILDWKKLYLKHLAKIAILTKTEYNFMAKGYYGGHTELYIPRINWGYLYDINSQYPYAMTKLMPIGNPIYSTDTNLDNYFGVVKAKITTPKYLKVPILPVKCEDKRVRCVLGEWIGTYCSEELKNARDNYGYKIEVLEGYKFQQGYIFNNFVKKYYSLKSEFKGTALGNIYKLILNNLYGRFGMKPIRTVTELMNQSQTEKLQLTHNILDIEDYGNGYEMVTYEVAPELEKNRDNIINYVTKKLSAETQESHFDISVAISIFITAYARIHIHSYVKNYNLKIYYMDTDSIVTDKPLPDHEVGDELGQMKLEYNIVEGLFSSPKTYWHKPLFEKNSDKNLIPIVKSKGTGKDISKESFEKLLQLETITYSKEKWFKDRENSTIHVKNIDLPIRGGTNKRRMIIHNGVWIDTEPLYYNEIPKDNNKVITYSQDLLPAPNNK